MRLTPSDPDISTLIGRIKSNEIDLQPDFQRGEVWTTSKKQRLVDSILRDWHIPPLHVIVDAESNQQLVLDGQQRLVAIRDFVNGVFPVDGRVEPLCADLKSQHGKRYSELREDLRRRFDQFTIRVFRITDYFPEEPGELFYRLNQPTALTAAEQRNAFFGETRRQIKSLVEAMEAAELGGAFWGFSNARMAYDDMLSRAVFFLEHNSLKKRVTAGTLADRFRSGDGFSSEAVGTLRDVIGALGESAKILPSAPQFNKATAQSLLIFLSTLRHYNSSLLTAQNICAFLNKFEQERLSYQIGLSREETLDDRMRGVLLRMYDDRSTSRVADTLSVQCRDFVLWSFFLIFHPSETSDLVRRDMRLGTLRDFLETPSLENMQNMEKVVSSLNWGDPIWQ